MSSANTCLMTPRSGRSPEIDSDWVSTGKGWGRAQQVDRRGKYTSGETKLAFHLQNP